MARLAICRHRKANACLVLISPQARARQRGGDSVLLFLEAGIVARHAETIAEHFKPIFATHLIAASLLLINSG